MPLSQKVSIVMPIFNIPLEYLKESVESVLKQTFTDFEFLIIDDGSTETQGIEWLRTLQDTRIRLIHNSHDFIDSLNRGISESKGKYIAWMDADDIMLPNRLQVQFDFMETKHEIDVCGSWMEVFGLGTDIVRLPIEHVKITDSMLLYNTMVHPAIMLRKSSVCKYGTNLYKKGYDCAEDFKLWTDLAMNGLQFANIPEVLLKYRNSENQVSNRKQKEMLLSSLKVQLEYAEWVMEKMLEKENRLFVFFDELIKLRNDGIITVYTLIKTVHYFMYNIRINEN